ncbi:hypothetical protein HDU99_003591, partial [Rhizoclosmatium hyalinum]
MFLELVYKWAVLNSPPSLSPVILSSSAFLCRVLSINGGMLNQMIEMNRLFDTVFAETQNHDGRVIVVCGIVDRMRSTKLIYDSILDVWRSLREMVYETIRCQKWNDTTLV